MPVSGADSLKPSAFVPVCTAAGLLVGSTSLFFVFTWTNHLFGAKSAAAAGVTPFLQKQRWTGATLFSPDLVTLSQRVVIWWSSLVVCRNITVAFPLVSVNHGTTSGCQSGLLGLALTLWFIVKLPLAADAPQRPQTSATP
ncbi:hypothetical protein EYF80_008546 [Liparis tanakae]|uniref:Uncharacterized protein n=1 Tax=Liparis tanakae TaxID=230148 RepID=A0A4Z2IVB3_9TELE|nr:hypothetical protein EYF80_008546 [Liparis tanakae]